MHRKAIVTTHSPNTPEPQTTPLAARIRLAHAYFQRIADMHSIDILHVKGYAFSQEIYRKAGTAPMPTCSSVPLTWTAL